MIIKDRKEVELVQLSDIFNGEAFEHEKDVYMRCCSFEIKTLRIIAVNLKTGLIHLLDNDILVEPLDAEIIINRQEVEE